MTPRSVPPAVRGELLRPRAIRPTRDHEERGSEAQDDEDEGHGPRRLLEPTDRLNDAEDREAKDDDAGPADEHVARDLPLLHERLRGPPRLDQEEAEDEPKERADHERQGPVNPLRLAARRLDA